MARIFKDNGYTDLKGLILPYGKVKLFKDMEEKKLNPDRAKSIVAEAEKMLDAPIPPLTLSLFRDFELTGTRANFENNYRGRRRMLAVLIYAEWIDGKGRFLEKLMDVIWATLEESCWAVPAHLGCAVEGNPSRIPDTFREGAYQPLELYSAGTASALATALYLLRDRLDAVTPIISERIERELSERIIKPYLNCVFGWTGDTGQQVNNWLTAILYSVIHVTAEVVHDDETRTAVLNKAIRHLDHYTSTYPEDGSCDEGAGYWSGASAALFDCLEVIYDMTDGKVNMFENKFIRGMGEYIEFANIHDNAFINFADCYAFFRPDGALVERFGRRTGSISLETFGKVMSSKQQGAVIIHNEFHYRQLKSFFTPTVTETPVTRARKYAFSEGNGISVSRECEDTSKGTYLALKGGHNGESHNHNDLGSILVYKNANPVLLDPGCGLYTKDTFSDKRYTILNYKSSYHNTVSLNGFDQIHGSDKRAEKLYYNEENGELAIEIKSAYPDEAGVLSFVRAARLEGAAVRIFDKVELKESGLVEWHFMTRYEPSVISDGKVGLPCDMTLEFNPTLNVRIEKVEMPSISPEKTWGVPYLWRVTVFTNTKSGSFEFTVK